MKRSATLTEQEWTAALIERDWDKVLALCDEDIVYMPADHSILRGHAAFRAWLDQFPPIVRFTQPLEEVEGQGNLAIGRATFAATVDLAGQRVDNRGKALCWFEKDSVGRWLVKAACWNWTDPCHDDEDEYDSRWVTFDCLG